MILKRLASAVPVTMVAIVVIFLILQLAPGDPAAFLAGADASPEDIAAIRSGLGLDRPVHVQFWDWFTGLLRGDLGTSLTSKVPISDVIGNRILITLQLGIAGAIVAITLGMIFGCVAGVRRGGAIDAATTVGTGFAMATPEFWYGILLTLLFAVRMGWLPSQGMPLIWEEPGDALKSLVLPALAISLHPTALITRTVKAAVAKTLAEDYIRMARAKGAWGVRLGLSHVLRNALIPILTIIGVTTGHMLGGAVIIESVFSIPGLGSMLVSGVGNRDYPTVQAALLILMLKIVLVNLITDVAYSVADPRIRSGATARIARR
jgi:peptide/nickel transport system permease protein